MKIRIAVANEKSPGVPRGFLLHVSRARDQNRKPAENLQERGDW